ncbi:hypothetical protein QYM36_006312 [Artemia franciscana]|uniref:Uncharacterized protein n=1 Tax=Artemia franciscana TaxID=6661 RepID=A0AA88HUU5_ARTSF|nr:hypothetical protein QYM36_006312 [Artemia franciscana]
MWVRFDESSRGHKAVEENKLKQPECSYMVCMEDGSLLPRNQCHLHPKLEPITTESALTITCSAEARYFNQYPEQYITQNGAAIEVDRKISVPDCSSAGVPSCINKAEIPNIGEGKEREELIRRGELSPCTRISLETRTQGTSPQGRTTYSGRLSKTTCSHELQHRLQQ